MLEIDWVTILWEIVNFVIITIALYFLVFKPIVKRSEARAIEKSRLFEELIRDREKAAADLKEINARLASLDDEIQQITDEAYEQNKILQAELLEATRAEANHILQNALVEVQKEQVVNIKQYRNEIIDTVLSISNQSLRKVVPLSVHASLIEGFTQEILNLGKTQMRQVQAIRESLSKREATAYVTSALPLTSEQELSLVRTFNALVDSDVNIDIEIDELLIAGIKVRLGDMIIENSLASQLEKIRSDITETLESTYLDHDG